MGGVELLVSFVNTFLGNAVYCTKQALKEYRCRLMIESGIH